MTLQLLIVTADLIHDVSQHTQQNAGLAVIFSGDNCMMLPFPAWVTA